MEDFMNKILLGLLCINTAILAEGIKLNTSVISTSSLEDGLKKMSANTFVVERKEIEEGGYSDIVDVLRRIPSIQIQKIGGSSVVDIRGGGLRAKDTVKILLDGVPLNYPITAPLDVQGNTELDSIPLEIIERIEVLPSGGTILFGDNSSGGVINIVTNKKLNKDFQAGAFTRFQENTWNRGVSLGKRLDKVDFKINYNETDKSENFYFGREDIKNLSAYLNYDFSERGNISVNYLTYRSKKDILQPLTESQYNNRDRDYLSTTYYETEKDSINTNFNYKISERNQFGLNIGYTNIDSYTEIDPATLLPIPNIKGSMIGDFKDEKINISPRLTTQLNENLSLVIGYDYERTKAERNLKVDANGQILVLTPVINMVQNFDLKKETHAGYIKAIYTTGDFSFTPGYRYEAIKTDMVHRGSIQAKQANGTNLPAFFPIPQGDISNDHSVRHFISTGEFGAVYQYRATGKIGYNISGGETTPSINKYINSSFITGEVFKLNPILKNEKYIKNEITISDYVFDSLISFTLFDTRTQDELGMNGMVPTSWEYYNIDKTRRTGVELSAIQYLGKFTLSESFTYIDSEILKSSVSEERGKEIPYVSDFSANGSVSYKVTDRISTSLSGNYRSKYRVGGKFTNGELTGFPFNPSINGKTEYYEAESKSSLTFDWGINYSYGGLILTAGINNIFNEKGTENISLVQKGTFLGGTKTETVYNPTLRRNTYLGFSYNF